MRAVTITLASAFILGGSLGLVQAQVGQDAVPAEFGLPRPAVGDAAVYAMSLRGDWKFDEEPLPDGTEHFRFQWGPVEERRDGQGVLRPVSTVATRSLSYYSYYDPASSLGDPWSQSESVVDVDAETLETIAVGTWGEQSYAESSTVVGIPVTSADLNLAHNVRFYPMDAQPLFVDDCILQSPFQGVSLALADEIPHSCRLSELGVSVQDATMEPIGWATTQTGHRALQMQISDSRATMDLFYVPDIAYPVEIHAVVAPVTGHGSGGHGEREIRLLQTHYAAGIETLQGGPAREDDALPVPSQVPLLEYGLLDDTGVDHAFPASAAWDAAVDHPNEPMLRDYLKAHPEAYVFSQSFDRMEDNQRRERVWEFALKAEESILAFDVVEVTRFATLQDLAPAEPLTEIELRMAGASYAEYYAEFAPAPGSQPLMGPRVLDLLDWHGEYAELEAPSDSDPWYAMLVLCMPDCPSDDPSWSGRYSAGWDAGFENKAADVDSDSSPRFGSMGLHKSILTWDFVVGAMYIFEIAMDVSHNPPRMGGGVPGSAAPDAGEQDPSLWAPPAAGVVAGMAAFSILIGLAYYFAPALKGLPVFGMFSRLRQSALLDHPKRARIMQTIEGNPGVHFKQLQRQTGLANGTLHHHLRILSSGGLIQVRRGTGYTCYFAGSRLPAASASATPALKSDGARAVLQAVAKHPGLSGQDVGQMVNLSNGTVGYHLRKLRAAGLVEGTRDERRVRLRVTPEGRRLAKAA